MARRDFKYLQDRLFLGSGVVYLLNLLFISNWQWAGQSIARNFLNDLLLVPVALPLILFSSHILKIRSGSSPPTLLEIFIPTTIWAIAFEFVGPNVFNKGTSDSLDIAAYFLGGCVAWGVWNRGCLLRFRSLIGRTDNKFSQPKG